MKKNEKLSAGLCKCTFMVAIMAGLLAGCAKGDTRSYEGLTVSNEQAPRVGEVVLASRSCPILNNGIAPPPKIVQRQPQGGPSTPKSLVAGAAIAAPLLGIAVDLAANVISEELKQAQEGLNGGFLALGSVGKIQGRSSVRPDDFICVIVARGLIGDWTASKKPPAASSGKMTQAHLGLLGFADYPAFYLEMSATVESVTRVTLDDTGQIARHDEDVLTLSPVYLRYAQSSATRLGNGKKTLTVALALARKQPATKDKLEEGASSVFRLNFGRLNVGHEYDKPQLKNLVASQVVDNNAGPSIAALVSESEDPGVALVALSKAFADNKDGLTKAVKDAISGAVP